MTTPFSIFRTAAPGVLDRFGKQVNSSVANCDVALGASGIPVVTATVVQDALTYCSARIYCPVWQEFRQAHAAVAALTATRWT